MSALYVLGHGIGFCSCKALCNISTSEVCKFFHLFLDALVDMQDEYISLPSNMAAFRRVTHDYEENGLPGCVGSMDVVHVKWSNCPMGNHYRAKGKKGYPTLAFQCITDFNHHLLLVYGSHFGTHNDKNIVKHDTHMKKSGQIGSLQRRAGSFMLQMVTSVTTEVCMSFATMDICHGLPRFAFYTG